MPNSLLYLCVVNLKVVELFKSTLKEAMWKYFSAKINNGYLDLLDERKERYIIRQHPSLRKAASDQKNGGAVCSWQNVDAAYG